MTTKSKCVNYKLTGSLFLNDLVLITANEQGVVMSTYGLVASDAQMNYYKRHRN